MARVVVRTCGNLLGTRLIDIDGLCTTNYNQTNIISSIIIIFISVVQKVRR